MRWCVCCKAGAGGWESMECLSSGARKVLLSCLSQWRPFSFPHSRVSLYPAPSPTPLGWQGTAGLRVGGWEAGWVSLLSMNSSPAQDSSQGVQVLHLLWKQAWGCLSSYPENPVWGQCCRQGGGRPGTACLCTPRVPTHLHAAHHPLW